MKKNLFVKSFAENIKNLQSLSFIKATAWVILGISSMFSSQDLISVQREDAWLATIIRFGLALAYLLAGLFLQKDQSKNIFFLMMVILIDMIVSILNPIGLYDILMVLFDVVFYWLIFNYLKKEKL
jgi:hypothetical protein